MLDSKGKIGVFDSGVGGLTVLKELIKLMPNEDYIYLADLKNSPYGEKTPEEIQSFATKNIEYLISQGAKVIVIACNTASSYNIESIRERFDVPILTVLEAAVKAIGENHKNVLLAATTATVNSGAYDSLIRETYEDVNLSKQACKDIVPNIENNILTDNEIQYIVDSYIKQYSDSNIDLVLLGCTHYPLWSDYFKRSIGEDVDILDPALSLAKETRDMLNKANKLNTEGKLNIKFTTTANKEKFKENAQKIIKNIEIKEIDLIKI